jgi:hypothetical protein
LSVEFTLNHPLARSHVERVRRVEQILDIEIENPIRSKRIAAAKIQERALRVEYVAGSIATDAKQVVRDGVSRHAQIHAAPLIEYRSVPSILGARGQRRVFARANLEARVYKGVVGAGSQPAQDAGQIPEVLLPVEFHASRVRILRVRKGKQPQRYASVAGDGLIRDHVGDDIVRNFLIKDTERQDTGLLQILFDGNVKAVRGCRFQSRIAGRSLAGAKVYVQGRSGLIEPRPGERRRIGRAGNQIRCEFVARLQTGK